MIIKIPNCTGCVVGVVQLILYAIYCDKTFMTSKRSFSQGMDQINGMPRQEKKQSSILSKEDVPV